MSTEGFTSTPCSVATVAAADTVTVAAGAVSEGGVEAEGADGRPTSLVEQDAATIARQVAARYLLLPDRELLGRIIDRSFGLRAAFSIGS
jgi:hypothetical protein